MQPVHCDAKEPDLGAPGGAGSIFLDIGHILPTGPGRPHADLLVTCPPEDGSIAKSLIRRLLRSLAAMHVAPGSSNNAYEDKGPGIRRDKKQLSKLLLERNADSAHLMEVLD